MAIDVDYNDLIPTYSQDKMWLRLFTNYDILDYLNKYIRVMVET